MTDRATLEARLAEAEQALHQLRLGKTAVQVRTSDGKSVSYAPPEAARLEAYVARLRRQLGQARRPRAIGVGFR